MKSPTGEAGYSLYTLVHDPEATVQFSPYVWKTIAALRYLHVPFTQKHLTFDDIRTKLSQELGDEEVLVPVLKDEGGEWIKDSFDIALYLDRAHALPKGKSLFLHGVGGREFCRFINLWTDTVLAPDLAVLIRPRVYAAIPPDSPSAKYFLSSRFDSSPDKASSALSQSNASGYRSEQFSKARKTLQLLHTMLDYQASQGKKFIGGEFSYADCCVLGLYMFSTRWVPECQEGVWEGSERVKEWLGSMKALGVVTEEEMAAGK